MNSIVDTSVWSLALRLSPSSHDAAIAAQLRALIADDCAIVLGAIRQEILSGVRNVEQFTRLRDYLRAFPDVELVSEDYELAADFFNTCRRNGLQGSNTDFLLCAVAHRRNYSIFTTDNDFQGFQVYIPVQLLSISG